MTPKGNNIRIGVAEGLESAGVGKTASPTFWKIWGRLPAPKDMSLAEKITARITSPAIASGSLNVKMQLSVIAATVLRNSL